MQVADGDGNSQTDPPQGIYLSAMVLRAEGFEDSEPYMFVHRTSELTNEPRDVATTWVIENYDLLVGETLLGDYDSSGSVDGKDFLDWQRNRGGTADLTIWQGNYGFGALSVQGVATSVPEPGTLLSAMIAIASFTISRRHT